MTKRRPASDDAPQFPGFKPIGELLPVVKKPSRIKNSASPCASALTAPLHATLDLAQESVTLNDSSFSSCKRIQLFFWRDIDLNKKKTRRSGLPKLL
jgi:hypothetical protein